MGLDDGNDRGQGYGPFRSALPPEAEQFLIGTDISRN